MINRELFEEMLVEDEGLRLHVYDDATGQAIVPGYTVVGNPTIGIGRCLNITGVSFDEVMFMCRNDMNAAIKAATKYEWFDRLNEARKLVILCMLFQLGGGGFAGFKKTIKALEKQDFEKASEEMLDSLWAKQVNRRAKKLAQIMKTGKLPEKERKPHV